MREYAEPTPNAHGRGVMPQTDKVDGEFMKPTAAPVSESKRGNTIMKRTIKTMESSRMHPELTCDLCGFSSDQEDHFDICGDKIVCDMCRSRDKYFEEYDESWIGDKAKAGWNKIKQGAKAVGKAIGNTFNGPFRKGDHIVMKGEDGETYKGTIRDFDLGDKTYEVLLGNPVNEGFDSEYDEEDEEWIAGVPDLGDAVYFQGCRIPKQDIYMELYDCGVDCYDDAGFDEYCKSNQEKVYGLLSDMCYAYPVNEGLEEDIQEMPDRADELESEIKSLWDELGHLSDGKYKIIIDLISRYLELERLKPGSLLPLDFKESAENPSKDEPEEEEPSQVSRDLAEYYSGRRYTGD